MCILCLYLVPSDDGVSVLVTLTVVSDIYYILIELPTKYFGQRQPVVNSRSMGVQDIINDYIRIRRDPGSATCSARKNQNDFIIIIAIEPAV